MNDIMAQLKENVIQGRITQDDEGIDDTLTGPGVVELTRMALDSKIPVKQIIADGLTAGMEIVGQKFNAKEYYVPDMLASAEAVSEAMDILKPHLEGSGVASRGKFAIVTVKGDIHDIGKNIVAILLKGAGYEVDDLGIDVPTEKIVEYVREQKPDFLGLSALLTTTMLVMGEIIEALSAVGLRGSVKVLIGGAAVSEEFAREIGADTYCADGFEAVRVLDSYRAE
ncbi:MAG TPA: cobalamin-binding protein [Deltaproteobacteria bacterium]|nr:cobalamin-binding protein [Deltaproteobacteria bacterium]